MSTFEVVCEIEPATRPDLMSVRHQIGVLSTIATRFLIPDNHIGRATVSSVAVAHEVAQMGCRAVACVNARDRNMLGFRRDLLTAAAYGVEEFLFVYGDRPETGRRSDDLTVRSMIDMARDFAEAQATPMRIGVSCTLGAVPAWKHAADVWYLQVSYDVDAMISWRSGIEFDGAIYAGVMALPSASMARKISADVPQLAVPAPRPRPTRRQSRRRRRSGRRARHRGSRLERLRRRPPHPGQPLPPGRHCARAQAALTRR